MFDRDFRRLKQRWTTPATGTYFQTLRAKFDELADGAEGGRWYLPHHILRKLIDGSPDALQSAKADFLKEWSHGDTLDRRVHYWNSLQFKTGDRWICAAMLSQLLILWDWLAAAGVWNDAEIDAAATEALDVVEAYLEPHLKGRGHMPFLPDPINQTAACITGLLYVGFMFGNKWRTEQRAQRMYAFARNLLPDAIGQYPANGYDTDGFTYLRHIHLQVHTLSVALLEQVEGGDWYHRRFAPHHLSLADLNEMQLDFVTPSGYTWPLGRYGYVKSWNLFNQSYATRRSGDVRYLQVARRDNEQAGHSYNSPWLGMDLVLGLLWYPGDLDAAIDVELAPIPQKRRVVADSWAVFTSDADRMLAVAMWVMGKAPHFFLEAHGSPLIIGGMEEWPTANGVQCDPEKWGMKHWLTPGGTLLHYCDIPGLQAAYFDTTATYPHVVDVQRATRAFINCDAGMVISDRFSAECDCPAVWQAATWATTTLDGTVATVQGPNHVKLRAVSAAGDWTLRPAPDRKSRTQAMNQLDVAMLELHGGNGHSDFDVLLDWNQHSTQSLLRRERPDLLTLNDGNSILLPAQKSTLRNVGPYQTDAPIALYEKENRLCVAAVRSVREGADERLWASCALDVTLTPSACWISGLKYGEFVTLREPSQFICIRIGNGIEVWGRSASPMRLHIRQPLGYPVTALQMNGGSAELNVLDQWIVIDIPGTSAGNAAAGKSLAAAVASGSTPRIIRALHEVQQAMAWECAGDVRELFKWDASTEPVLAGNALKTEATYVRLEAAATAMAIGDRSAIPGLIDLLLDEARRDYAPVEKGFGGAKWWGFPTRSVTLEALMILHANEALAALDEMLSHEVWPHGFAAANRAREVLGV